MGVVNLTPDSFSDGGKVAREGIERSITPFLKENMVVDIGAESTAPMNTSITAEEEKLRLIPFCNFLEKMPKLSELVVSLDSYRFETARWFAEQFSTRVSELLWNDVSGSIDGRVFEFLDLFPKARYIACINRAARRERVQQHRDFSFQGGIKDFDAEFKKDLSELTDTFSRNGFSERVLIDPCFGFAKTTEQSRFLMRTIADWSKFVSSDIPIVIGLSRKSFMRYPEESDSLEDKDQILWESELLQAMFLARVLEGPQLRKRALWWRIHDVGIFRSYRRHLDLKSFDSANLY